MGTASNLKRAAVSFLVPLPSILFYLYFINHYKTSTVDGTTLSPFWSWCVDHPLLLVNALFFFNVNVLFWIISQIQKSHWMIDLYWTVIPMLLVYYYATYPLAQYNLWRSRIVIALTWIWSLRLTHNYFRREKWQWGVREDWRFTDMRGQYGKNWWWISFFSVYASQQMFLVGICLPFYIVHSVDKPLDVWDFVAVAVCLCGIVIAYFADTQLHEFVTRNDKLKELGKPTVPNLGGSHDDDGGEIEPISHKKPKKTEPVEPRKGDEKSLDGKKKKANREQHSTQPDIPHIIEAPKSFEEFCAILENCSNENVILVVDRIRKSNAIQLAAENRKKIQVFYGVLLQYFAVLANKKPLNIELLNFLVKPLMEMSVEIPYFSAICARQRILRTRAQFCEALKNTENSCWPSMKTLSLLRLWSMIFPCSDFRHVVMTPVILLMSEYLMRCPILSGRDIAIGSFLCTMVLSITKQSQKFCPEAIMFLRTLLMATTERKPSSYQESQFYHLMELKELKPLLHIHDHVNEIRPLNFLMVMDMQEDTSFFSSDDFRVGVLVTMVETLQGFVDIYKELNSFPEVFLPISMLLLEVAQQENMPATLQDKFKDVAELINKKANEHHMTRKPLQMQKKKPVPIKLVAPKFEENFVKGRDYDPDRERVERRKLKKLVKREAKGAARELRKDNYFLFEVKEKDKALLEGERAENYGKARAFLQEQEHAFKSGQLGKGKGRKRRR